MTSFRIAPSAILTCTLALLGAGHAFSQTTTTVPPTVTIYAGTGTPGSTGDNGPATQAEISVAGMAADSSGNLYFTDSKDYTVRQITTGGVISTIAGGNFNKTFSEFPAGPAVGYALYDPTAITVSNGTVFFDDIGIDAVNPAGTLTPDNINSATDLAVDATGNVYGILNNSAIYRYTPGASPAILAGSSTPTGLTSGDGGPASLATFAQATALAIDGAGNIYVADASDNTVRKFAPGGNITTIAGDANSTVIPANGPPIGDGGAATQAPLAISPLNGSIGVDPSGNLYIVELLNRIRKVSTTGVIQTYAGTGSSGRFLGNAGPALNAIIVPAYIAVDTSGNVFVVHSTNGQQLILKITPQTTTTTTGGGGGGTSATAPSIGAVISAAANLPTVTPGGFASIYGTNLSVAGDSRGWATADFAGNLLPASLDGVSVMIDGKLAGVSYISPTQLNVLVPDDTTVGLVNVTVTNAMGTSAAYSVNMAAYSPAFFTLDGTHIIAQSFPTYNLVAPTSFGGTAAPAASGSTVIIYGTGFGATTPATPSNMLVSAGEPLANTVTVTVGGMPATLLYAGINAIGLYQLNVTLPTGLASGDQPIVATVGTGPAQVLTQTGAVIPIQ